MNGVNEVPESIHFLAGMPADSAAGPRDCF